MCPVDLPLITRKGAQAQKSFAVSGAQTCDVLERQSPGALALRPDIADVVVGVNDTLRCTFDIQTVAARLDQVYAALTGQGAVLLTACLPGPGAIVSRRTRGAPRMGGRVGTAR